MTTQHFLMLTGPVGPGDDPILINPAAIASIHPYGDDKVEIRLISGVNQVVTISFHRLQNILANVGFFAVHIHTTRATD